MAFMKAPSATASPSDPLNTQFRTFSQTAEAAMHAPRADSFTASPTTSLSSSSTTNRPFFQDPSSVTPVPTPDGPGESHSLAKSVLEYAILSVGVVLVGCLLLNRYNRLKRHNQPLSRFFSRTFPASSSSSSTAAHLSSAQPSRFPRTTGLSDVPPYPYAHRTRAHDTDVAGRRLGGPLTSDHDGYIGDKDVLPAYEHAGGPPKYGELEMMPIRSPDPALSPAVGGTGPDEGGVGAEEMLARAPSDNTAALARPEPDPDIERGDAVPTPTPVHVRGRSIT